MKKIFIFLLCVILLTAICGCVTNEKQGELVLDDEITTKSYGGKKVLFVNSYHAELEWSRGIISGFKRVMDNEGVEYKMIDMDTKRNTQEDFILDAAKKVKAEIESYKPDVVVTADDNAFKYVVMPFYKDAELPFVFVGLNWDASVYGAPYSNTAGMVEIATVVQLIEHLSRYSEGERLGWIAGDSMVEYKDIENMEKLLGVTMDVLYYVKTFEEWKEKYKQLQDEVDMVLVWNNAAIDGWDDEEAKTFVLENTKIPSGSKDDWMIDYNLICLAKSSEEFGEWGAETALRILDGELPSGIPLARNKRGDLMLNLNIADKLGIVFAPSLIKNAEIIIKE